MAPVKVEFPAKLLRRLHGIHRQKHELSSQLARGPRQLKAGEAMVAKAQAATEVIKESLKKAKLASDEKQLQLKSREARIEELKAKLNMAASNREFDTFKEQIAADHQANEVQSDEILESFERIDVLHEELAAAEAELKKQQDDQEARLTEVEERLIVVRENVGHVDAQLADAEKKIPSAAMDSYKRLVQSKGEEALAPMEVDSCGGCNQTLTTHVLDQLRLSIMVNCPNCNAFLYISEDNRVS
ncbi:zinc ribbon domain-containing protein [Planctomycetes bacterium K23_9]|uniref:Zinc ribbon domain protein n=1 Tax=Stieleria marina TaxID=1930275 RepID=A0A517NRN7_9BACT|nr:Putative zinc ribbon domain protein [Planctomycetes bacterium K23_9]